ncbi:MAG: pilus assembly protein [Acidimicrobiales bacterium]|nr:pilus assembly protein [Acidimicrobiales bacterium]
MTTGTRRHLRADRGLVSSEMAVVMVTFFAGFLMLVVFAGRVGQATNDVRSAAQEAARAASLAATPDEARQAAAEMASANLTTSGVGCARGLSVSADVDDFRAGGVVAVTISCTATLSDVSSLRLPGSRTYTATAIEVIDRFVSSPPGGTP